MSQQASVLFREFITLFKSWPVDKLKAGRCLSEHTRKKFEAAFNNGELTQQVDTQRWNNHLNDLKPLVNNEIARKYQRSKELGSLGLDRDVCKVIMSNEMMKEINKHADSDQ